ncbi:relaxase domain-containing protein [Iamia sp.]|uniref:relaxase domain-containing protein n=1 Tax=Iamia sp. TaxID=2722710 RepID=UPI0039C86F0B
MRSPDCTTAGAAGLSGDVTGDDLRSLQGGRHRKHGDRLGRRFGDSSVRGLDPTFGAPGSVPAQWASSPDDHGPRPRGLRAWTRSDVASRACAWRGISSIRGSGERRDRRR